MRGKHGIDRHTYRASAALYAKRGRELPHAKLTEEQVAAILRRLGPEKGTDLAREFGVHPNTVYAIAARRNWSHVR